MSSDSETATACVPPPKALTMSQVMNRLDAIYQRSLKTPAANTNHLYTAEQREEMNRQRYERTKDEPGRWIDEKK